MYELTVNELFPLIEITAKAGKVPYIKGAPGIGKSALAQKFVKKYDLSLVDCRLAGYDPTDLNGFPVPNAQKGRSGYLPPEDFPLEGDELPKKPGYAKAMSQAVTEADKKSVDKNYRYNGWLIFFDEFSSAPASVQAAAYKILLDRKIGQRKLHSQVILMAAGNRDVDKAITHRMSTALQSRVIHYTLKSDTEAWLDWANKVQIDHRAMAYVSYKKESNDFDPTDQNAETYMCERTLEFLSDQLKVIGAKVEEKHTPLIVGTIGLKQGIEFSTYCQVFDQIPTVEEIEKNPSTTIVPDRPDQLFAVSSSIGNHLTTTNIDSIMKYIVRMEPEFQQTTLRYSLAREPKLIGNPEVGQWVKDNASKLAYLRSLN